MKGNFDTQVSKNTGKVPPSGTPFFIMKKMNWSMHSRSETDCTEYYVYSDGRVEYQYNGDTLALPFEELLSANANDYWSGLITKVMNDEDFLTFCNILKCFPENNATGDCCDGTGYEMTLYDDKGNIIHTTCGYIYGNDILKKIEKIITKS